MNNKITGARTKKKTVTITIPLDIAETLQGFISGGIGSSDCDDFSEQMGSVEKKLINKISKHYNKKNSNDQ